MNNLIAISLAAVLAGSLPFMSAATAGHDDGIEPLAAGSAGPAPETLLLFGAGLGIVGFALMRRRRRD